jgi:hypothetical protein
VRNPSVSGSLSQIDNKTLQWFGATISTSSKDGGPILVSVTSKCISCILSEASARSNDSSSP